MPARELIPEAPASLQALSFFRRPATGPTLRLMAVGDVGFSGRVAASLDTGTGTGGGSSEAGPLSAVAPLLRTADVLFGNLETPLVAAAADRRALFAAPPSAARCLDSAGFSIVNLANNHTRDFGAEGLHETLDHLRSQGIATLGAGSDDEAARSLRVTELSGLALGWLGCARTLQAQKDPGDRFWELDPAELEAAVRQARPAVDVLAVSIHTGYMFLDYPHPDHRQLAHRLAEAGADLILLHHAHVLQGLEVVPVAPSEPSGRRRQALLAYNLGNFLFDWTEGDTPVDLMEDEQRQALCLTVELDSQGLVSVTALPGRIRADAAEVAWAIGADGKQILRRLARISRNLEGNFAPAFHRQRSERNAGLTLGTIAGRLRAGDVRWLLKAVGRARPAHLRMLVHWLGQRLGVRREAS